MSLSKRSFCWLSWLVLVNMVYRGGVYGRTPDNYVITGHGRQEHRRQLSATWKDLFRLFCKDMGVFVRYFMNGGSFLCFRLQSAVNRWTITTREGPLSKEATGQRKVIILSNKTNESFSFSVWQYNVTLYFLLYCPATGATAVTLREAGW